MSVISQNLEAIRKKIAAAAQKSGRCEDDITLVAVTKLHPHADIEEAVKCGVTDIGENYVQEACGKYEKLGNIAKWHMIGHLQKNKVKYIVPFVSLIESVDSFELAREINKRAKVCDRIIDILIEVKISEESTKTGINPDSMISLAEQISLLDSIRIKGLMGMPPLDADPRPYFDKLYKLWQSLPIDNRVFLSMGMTQDYETAIHCGSNMVRIGTAIFGKRNFS